MTSQMKQGNVLDAKLDLRFRGDSTGEKEDVSVDEYLTKRFIEATNGINVVYLEKVQLENSDPLVMDAAAMKSLENFIKDFVPGSDRRDFNDLIDQIYAAIEAKDLSLQTQKTKLDEAIFTHDQLLDNYYNITRKVEQVRLETSNINRKMTKLELESLSSRLCKAIEEKISMIPLNYQKVDEAIIQMIKIVLIDRDHDADSLLKRMQVIDMTKVHYKREEICKLIYEHYRNNLRDTKDFRNTVKSEMMGENISLMDIGSFLTQTLDTSDPQMNPYAAKLRQVTVDLESLYKEVFNKSNSTKVLLNKFRLKYSKYKESDQGMKREILSDFEQIYKAQHDLDDIYHDLMVKDFCLGLGLIAKSRLFVNRRIQILAKLSIQHFAQLNESSEYLNFMEQAESQMAQRLFAFTEKFEAGMRRSHKLNSEEFLFRRFDDMDEKTVNDGYRDVIQRCKEVEGMLRSAEEELAVCVRRMKTGASKSGINHLIYESYTEPILLKTAQVSAQLEELKNFSDYHFNPQIWMDQRAKMEEINFSINMLEKEINATGNRPTVGQVKKIDQYIQTLKTDRIFLGQQYSGIAKTGREGRQYLFTYSEQMKYMLDKTDKYLRLYENSACRIKTGEEVKNNSEALDGEKIKDFMTRIGLLEQKTRQFTMSSDQAPPWMNSKSINDNLLSLEMEYDKLATNQELEDLFSSGVKSSQVQQNYYRQVFLEQLDSLLKLNRQLHDSLATISMERLQDNLQRFRPLDTFVEKNLRKWKDEKLIPEIENISSEIVSQRMTTVNNYDPKCCGKLTDLIKLYREIGSFVVKITEKLLDLSMTSSDQDIQAKVNSIKKMCNDYKIKSYSRALYYEVIEPCIVQVYNQFFQVTIYQFQ